MSYKKNNINEEMNKTLSLMFYNRSKTLLEQKSDVLLSKQTFGNCLQSFNIYNPNIKESDTNSQKINKTAKSIGESFSYKMFQQSGWGKSDLFKECENDEFSLSENFNNDLKKFNQEKTTLTNKPYFCYNKKAANQKWSVTEVDENLGTPNYMTKLVENLGTYDTCKINEIFKSVPKFDWNVQMKKEWSDIAHIALPLASIPLVFWGGTIGLAISGILEVADFMLYVKEGDWLIAAMAGVFLVIPGGQLIKKIPAVENFTSKTLGPAIKKIVNNLPLNQFEKELSKQILENKNWLKENYVRYSKSILSKAKNPAVKSSVKSFSNRLLSKYGVKVLINLILKLVKMGVWSTKWTIRITKVGVAVYYTVVQLAKKLEEKFGEIKELDNFSNNEKKLTPEQEKQPVDEVWEESKDKLENDVNEKIGNVSPEEINKLEKSFDDWSN
jgi:hypothetical protein